MNCCLIIHEHELTLKGGNRGWFEDRLIENARRALDGLLASDEVKRAGGRLIFELKNPPLNLPPAAQRGEIEKRMKHLFGAAFAVRAERVEPSLDAVIASAVKQSSSASGLLRRSAPRNDGAVTFKITTQRGDKRFPMTSQDVNAAVGAAVQEATGWKVNLDNPEIKFNIEILARDAYVGTERFDAPGGLPVGTSGRFMVMLSGGIDSPVAAYEIMKRGGRCDFIHFHSVPFTSRASVDKVQEIADVLRKFQGRGELHLISFAPIQQEIVTNAPDEFRVLLYRRFMVRIAQDLARRMGSAALVTGDNLGQVASQTIENMTVVEDAATLPLLRPLLTWNKDDIIRRAREIGTYDISIRPHDDCCTVLMPKNPATRARVEDVRAAEDNLDVETLCRSTLLPRPSAILKI